MTRPVRRPQVITVEPDEPPPGMTDATAAELAAAIAAVAPALENIAKFTGNLDGRLDALCKWLSGVKPWAIAIGFWAVTKYAPSLAEALGPLIQGAVQ